jgi:RND family efflux transporter MFP subunit
MTDTTYMQTTDAQAGTNPSLKRSRAALILIPLFFVAVMFLVMSAQGKQASIAAENNRAEVSQELDATTAAAIEAALPEGTSDEKQAAIKDAVAKELNARPGPQGNNQSEQGGGMLGLFFMLFFIASLLTIVSGIWRLLSQRAPGFVRVTNTITTPLMFLFGLSAAGLAIVALQEEPEEKRRPFNTLAVMADFARQEDVRLSVTTQGEVRPRVQINLVPEVGGKIVYVSPNFIDGGIIRKGETLIRIDPSDYEVSVISAEANLANAQQALTREIAEGEIARADLAELSPGGTPSPLALRQPQRQQAEAAVKASEAELRRANLQLERTSVRAPFDGRVSSKSSDIGQFVSPGFQLGEIFSTDSIEVRLPLTDADLAKIDLPIAFVAKDLATAPKVTLSTTLSGERREWEARIVRTDATYDTQTRALFAIAEVIDPFGRGAKDGVPLAPGLFVDAEVEGRAIEGAVVLPRDGLRPRNEVYVVDTEGNAEIRTASVIDTDATRAVLRGGVIAPGEIVIVSPMERSRIETPLKVLDVNNPKTVLVEPPKPDWMKREEAGADKSRDRESTDTDSSDTSSDESDGAVVVSGD